MENKHRPGPWSVNKSTGEIVDSNNVFVACVDGEVETEFDIPNANLISASPELEEAVELLLIYLGDWDDDKDETCVKARAALKKARGA